LDSVVAQKAIAYLAGFLALASVSFEADAIDAIPEEGSRSPFCQRVLAADARVPFLMSDIEPILTDTKSVLVFYYSDSGWGGAKQSFAQRSANAEASPAFNSFYGGMNQASTSRDCKKEFWSVMRKAGFKAAKNKRVDLKKESPILSDRKKMDQECSEYQKFLEYQKTPEYVKWIAFKKTEEYKKWLEFKKSPEFKKPGEPKRWEAEQEAKEYGNHTNALDAFFEYEDDNLMKGPAVTAFSGGIVVSATNGWSGSASSKDYKGGGAFPERGNSILLFNPEKNEFQYYGHLFNTNLKTGQVVEAGQAIGRGGATGSNAWPAPGKHMSHRHVHFELRSVALDGSVNASKSASGKTYLKEICDRFALTNPSSGGVIPASALTQPSNR
jgi:hypothetical protein